MATQAPTPALPYARDLRGYGRQVPHARWPGDAKIAVQFVLNYEEGGENNVLHGDPTSETFLSELVTAQAYENRHMTMESMYEYGSRVGVWRILREFEQRGLPLTVFGVVSALERYPELLKTFMDAGHEIANHGLRWIHYQNLPEATERRHVGVATHLLKELTGGAWPAGWYTGRDSPNTRRLVADQAATSTTATTTATTCPSGCRCSAPTAAWRRTWWCRTRWTPTTCASCRRRASTPANTSSTTCATASTRSMPKATRRRR